LLQMYLLCTFPPLKRKNVFKNRIDKENGSFSVAFGRLWFGLCPVYGESL